MAGSCVYERALLVVAPAAPNVSKPAFLINERLLFVIIFLFFFTLSPLRKLSKKTIINFNNMKLNISYLINKIY